jgi:GAF domain-containing protein
MHGRLPDRCRGKSGDPAASPLDVWRMDHVASEFREQADGEFGQRSARLVRALWMERGLMGRLEAVTALSKVLIDGCDAAGVALQVHGEARSLATTERVVLEVDLVQYATGEGPCLAAIAEGRPIRIDVVGEGEQWQHFSPGALDRGIESVLSLPIRAAGTTVGALNLYSRVANAFDDEAARIGQLLADYAGQAIRTSPLYAYSVDLVDEVLEELATSELVNTAVGLLMERGHVDSDAALRALADEAGRNRMTLREAAEWELREHELRGDGATRSEGEDSA